MKKPQKKIALIIIQLLLLNLIFIQDVFAYIDPGAGSYMVQIVLASIVGAVFTIKIYFSRIKAFFQKIFFKKK